MSKLALVLSFLFYLELELEGILEWYKVLEQLETENPFNPDDWI